VNFYGASFGGHRDVGLFNIVLTSHTKYPAFAMYLWSPVLELASIIHLFSKICQQLAVPPTP